METVDTTEFRVDSETLGEGATTAALGRREGHRSRLSVRSPDDREVVGVRGSEVSAPTAESGIDGLPELPEFYPPRVLPVRNWVPRSLVIDDEVGRHPVVVVTVPLVDPVLEHYPESGLSERHETSLGLGQEESSLLRVLQ